MLVWSWSSFAEMKVELLRLPSYHVVSLGVREKSWCRQRCDVYIRLLNRLSAAVHDWSQLEPRQLLFFLFTPLRLQEVKKLKRASK
jgi:hypothetical protein